MNFAISKSAAGVTSRMPVALAIVSSRKTFQRPAAGRRPWNHRFNTLPTDAMIAVTGTINRKTRRCEAFIRSILFPLIERLIVNAAST